MIQTFGLKYETGGDKEGIEEGISCNGNTSDTGRGWKTEDRIFFELEDPFSAVFRFRLASDGS